jgi:signal recognition particle receptor subunit beta
VLRKIWEKYFTQCNGLVFMLDGSDPIRFDEARETLAKMYDREGN